MSGNVWINLSSAALNLSKVEIDLIFFGTTLYNADATEVNELNLIVFMLLYLELPMGLIHVVPRLADSWKTMLEKFGMML